MLCLSTQSQYHNKALACLVMLFVTAAESFRKNEFVLAFDDLFSSFILVDDLESRLRVLSKYNLRILFPWTSFSCF